VADPTIQRELDVRALPAPSRHMRIFLNFAALPEGEDFVIVNDHDPKPLWYQLHYEHGDKFTWEYLEEGPVVWRVRIGRKPGR
jgi:uncharacterized protein (DUF2249 family)